MLSSDNQIDKVSAQIKGKTITVTTQDIFKSANADLKNLEKRTGGKLIFASSKSIKK